jgi:hypothetical protein
VKKCTQVSKEFEFRRQAGRSESSWNHCLLLQRHGSVILDQKYIEKICCCSAHSEESCMRFRLSYASMAGKPPVQGCGSAFSHHVPSKSHAIMVICPLRRHGLVILDQKSIEKICCCYAHSEKSCMRFRLSYAFMAGKPPVQGCGSAFSHHVPSRSHAIMVICPLR